jgi:hypothetical protein
MRMVRSISAAAPALTPSGIAERVRGGASLGRATWLLLGLIVLQALYACGSDRVVGKQCPGPYSGNATVEGPEVETSATVVGTSCAPCTNAPLKLDAHGCPVFVTFEKCGGDVCIGGQRIARPTEDAGAADAGDAGPGGTNPDAGDAAAEDVDAG